MSKLKIKIDDIDYTDILTQKEVTSAISSSSSDEEIPSAKAVYEIIGDVESLLAAL